MILIEAQMFSKPRSTQRPVKAATLDRREQKALEKTQLRAVKAQQIGSSTRR
jgi:hypothetical protein